MGYPPSVPRLRRVDCSAPGIRRKRQGKGWIYLDDDGNRVAAPEDVSRIRDLAIPPAWQDVWICSHPDGHLQATGTDAAGRKQYRYHDEWRRRRDQAKFDEMMDFAKALPALRGHVAEDLDRDDDLTFERVLACAVRLLDRGFFRIGSEDYAVTNETFGLATMRKEHAKLDPGGAVVFDYIAKSGKHRVQSVVDPEVFDIVARLKRRRGGGPELLAYRDAGAWRDVRSADINAYIKRATGAHYSAKDFRTWNATVLAAVALGVAGEAAGTATGRKRATVRAVKEVARYLGNTPAVCRASYIDPRVIDAYHAGLTIAPALRELADTLEPGELPIHHPTVETAVLDLIEEKEDSPVLEQVA